MSVRDIGKPFDEGGRPLPILAGGGFDLTAGEIVALVGPSGCGKSPLQCAGLLDRPTRGQIIISGVGAHKLPESERTMLRRAKIGFVYQRNNLLPDFSALENVMLPMMAAGRDPVAADLRARKLLKSANILHRGSHLPGAMSGGEQQRVAGARARANNPDMILADEPTGSLDPGHAKLVFDLLFDVVRKSGAAMLFVTHDMGLAEKADRMITIRKGRVAPA